MAAKLRSSLQSVSSASSGGGEPPPQIDIGNVAAEGSPPPVVVAAQSPSASPPARRNLAPALAEEEFAAESEEGGGDSGKDEAAPAPAPARPKGGIGSGAEPDGVAKSPVKPNNKRRLTALPISDPDPPKSPPPKSKKMKKKAVQAVDSGSGKPVEPLAAGKGKKHPSAQSRKKQHVEQSQEQGEKEEQDIVETPLPSRKSKRVAASSSGNNNPPDPKKTKIIVETASRRKWDANDEIMILKALGDHIHNGQMLPQEPGHPLFHHIAQRLEGTTTFNHNDVREKVRSLKRRYDNVVVAGTAPTKDHERHLYQLSCQVWGYSAARTADKQINPLASDQQRSSARDEHKSFAVDEAFAVHEEERSFDEMCSQFPQLAKEIKVLAEELPAIRKSFARLDGNQAVATETKLENLRWIDMKMQYKVKKKMAKIRNELLHHLMELRS